MAVNDQIRTFELGRSVKIIQATNRKTAELLAEEGPYDTADEAMFAAITRAGDPGKLSAKGRLRLETRIGKILDRQGAAVAPDIRGYLGELVVDEVDAQDGLLGRILSPLGLEPDRPTDAQALRLAASTRARGLLPREWIASLLAGDRQRVLQTLRASAADDLTAAETALAILGRSGSPFTGGVRDVSRRGLESTLQTLATHGADKAQLAMWEANEDVITTERWTAMLDGHTTPVCQSLDARVFPVGEGRRPPAHHQCRSRRLPIVPSLEVIPGAPGRDVLPSSVADSFDGKGPRALAYPDWLAKRSAKFQDGVLGPTRGKLFRTGKIEITKFVNDRGVQLTIPELRASNAALFEEAGLAREAPPRRAPAKTAAARKKVERKDFDKVKLRSPTSGTTQIPEDLPDTWDKIIQRDPKEFLDELTDGVGEASDVRFSLGRNELEVVFDIVDPSGARIAHMERIYEFDFATNEIIGVQNELFNVTAEFQGRGVAKRLLRNQSTALARLGSPPWGTTANITRGGYAWARYGYLPADLAEMEDIAEWVRKQAFFLEDTLAATPELQARVLKLADDLDAGRGEALWDIADLRDTVPGRDGGVTNLGNELLSGSAYVGELDFANPASLARFTEYFKKGS